MAFVNTTQGVPRLQIGTDNPGKLPEIRFVPNRQKTIILLMRGKNVFYYLWLATPIKIYSFRHQPPKAGRATGRVVAGLTGSRLEGFL